MNCGEFITYLWNQYQEWRKPLFFENVKSNLKNFASMEEVYDYGRRKGFIEQQDLLAIDAPVERRQAARILHQFLRMELKEAECENWDVAKQLEDLYQCRTCVNHVAQVYAKGIMGSILKDGKRFFGMLVFMTDEEIYESVLKVFCTSCRKVPERIEKSDSNVEISLNGDGREFQGNVSYEEAMRLMKNETGYQLIDVRTKREYEEYHLKGALHIPMARFFQLTEDEINALQKVLFLYCEKGYQSQIAASFLMEKKLCIAYSFGISANPLCEE